MVTLAARGADLLDGEAIGLRGIERALRARVIKRSQSEIDGECVLDDLNIALASATAILLTRAMDQLLIERQADLARCHHSRLQRTGAAYASEYSRSVQRVRGGRRRVMARPACGQ